MEEACIKTASPRTETAYKAGSPGEVAQHTEAPGLGGPVNAGAVQLKFAFLSGETPEAQADRGVSRGHSTVEVAAGRPEPDRCHSTTDPQPQGILADGRKQYRPARLDETMVMGSWCAEHEATMG